MLENEPTPRWHYWLLLLSPVILLSGCWDAAFNAFDDHFHIDLPPDPTLAWYPIMRWSYALDRLLFENWLPAHLGSWAPGVRLMNGLYHSGAAITLCRIFTKLGFSTYAALFGSLVFALHPTACESVCWVSERKNVLVALFSFLAVLTLLSWHGWKGMLATFSLFTLALLSKPSALGMLPVLTSLYVYQQFRSIEFFKLQQTWISLFKKLLLRTFLYILPFTLVSIFMLIAIMQSHGVATIPPPGGSIGTAILTDLEVISRYLFNLAAPISLSAVYYVDPVLGLADWRVPLYGIGLLLVVGASLKYSQNRRLTILGWCWMLGALSTGLNLRPNSFFMQDRYFYLSIPGVLIVLFTLFQNTSVSAKSVDRLSKAQLGLRVVAGIYVLSLCGLSCQRSAVWRSSVTIFSDAVRKQPLAAYGHIGLGNAWGDIWKNCSDRRIENVARIRWLEEWTKAVNCKDILRFSSYPEMALESGTLAYERNDLSSAERYWRIASQRPENWPAGWPLRADVQAQALRWLALLRLNQHRPEEAYQFADAAVKLADIAATRQDRAAAARAWAAALKNGDPNKARELLQQADVDCKTNLPPRPISPAFP